MNKELPRNVRAPINAHLDAVEKVLIDCGRTREQRRAIVDDLEFQILEMLHARSANPTLTDVEAVLGQMDPPSAYADANENLTVDKPHSGAAVLQVPPESAVGAKMSRTAKWGFICVLAALVDIPVQYILFMIVRGQIESEAEAQMRRDIERGIDAVSPSIGPHASHWNWVSLAIALFFMAIAILGTVLGWVGFVQIRNSKGVLRGTGLALFAGLFYPILLVLVLLILLIVALSHWA